jgi:Bacterial aa3 type cytochrome c oxidase subunit IV
LSQKTTPAFSAGGHSKGPHPMSAPQDSDYQPGSMDISQHKRAYEGFLTFTKYSLVGIFLIMALLAVFRTHG